MLILGELHAKATVQRVVYKLMCSPAPRKTVLK